MTDTCMANDFSGMERTMLGHPAGLITLFSFETWERFTFYGMRALLILFMTASAGAGGLGMTSVEAGAIYGIYVASVYLFSLVGGWLADRLLGQRSAAFWGGCMIAGGNFILAVPAGQWLFYAGLAVIVFGVGLLKPNVSVMVGALYENDTEARQDAGFSIFYFGIYLGAFTAPLVAGTIGETLGYRWGFFAAGVAMMVGTAFYVHTRHWLGDVGRHPCAATNATGRGNWRRALTLLALILFLAWLLRSHITVDAVGVAHLLGFAMVAFTSYFIFHILVYGGLDHDERRRVLVILILCLCAVLFIAGLEQSGSTMNLFARDHTDRSFLGQYFGAGMHPASWYQSIGPVFILLLSPLFAWIWMRLGRRGLDPSTPVKFGLSLILLGSSFLVLMLALYFSIRLGIKASPGWLFTVFFLQSVGELCIGPIGLASVTRLSPRRFAGQLMGMWFMAAAIGSLFAGLAGGHIGGAEPADMSRAVLGIGLMGIAAGLLMLLLSRRIQSLTKQAR